MPGRLLFILGRRLERIDLPCGTRLENRSVQSETGGTRCIPANSEACPFNPGAYTVRTAYLIFEDQQARGACALDGLFKTRFCLDQQSALSLSKCF